MAAVKQLKDKLVSEDLFNADNVLELRKRYIKQRKGVNFFFFSKKQELDTRIAALTYLLQAEEFKK